MARAWRAVADEQDWLDGEISPVSNEDEAKKGALSG